MIASQPRRPGLPPVESESRSPLELVVMRYDGALRFVGDAGGAR